MAFAARFGSLIRQSMSQGLVSNGQAPVISSMLNAIRCMLSSKLFIGGLSYGTDDQSVKEAFTSVADVAEDILRIMIFPLGSWCKRQVPLKRNHHFICTTCAKEGHVTAICAVVLQHPSLPRHPDDGEDPERILGPNEFIYTSRLHNTEAGGTDLVNYGSALFYVQHEMCVACEEELGVRYIRSNHQGKEVFMNFVDGCLNLLPWVSTEDHPLPPQFFLLERSRMAAELISTPNQEKQARLISKVSKI